MSGIRTFAETKDYILIALVGYVGVIVTAGAVWIIKNDTKDAVQEYRIGVVEHQSEKNKNDITTVRETANATQNDVIELRARMDAVMPSNDHSPRERKIVEK